MSLKDTLTKIIEILDHLRPLLNERYHVESIGVFGSYVRSEQRPESDLDILVSFSDTPGLLKFIELENYLSDTLNVKVDLVMADSIKPHIGEHILRELKTI